MQILTAQEILSVSGADMPHWVRDPLVGAAMGGTLGAVLGGLSGGCGSSYINLSPLEVAVLGGVSGAFIGGLVGLGIWLYEDTLGESST